MKNPMFALLAELENEIQCYYECEGHVAVKNQAHVNELKADIRNMSKADMKRWLTNFINTHNKYRKRNLDVHGGFDK